MDNYSGRHPHFPKPQFYTFGTTTTQPFLLVAPTHDQRRLSDSITNDSRRNQCHSQSQYPSTAQPDSLSRHTFHGGCFLNLSAPRACSTEDPLSRFSNHPKKVDIHRTVPQPELTTKEFDELGLPHFDLRYQLPASSIAVLGEHRFDLKQPSVTSVRIISRAFPWNIDVTKSRNGGSITWKDMLEALYTGLHKKIEDYEWPLLILDRDPQYKVDIETVANTRINDPDRTRSNSSVKPGVSETDDNHWSMKRIDCLGHKTTFLGFKQDKELEEMRRMPYSKLPEGHGVWVAELGMSRRVRRRNNN